ncbi:monovalent cation:proton antiporter-2 (CPA2) family protein [Rhodovulum sp. DZ06]|uniref:monovalent cation:proton antiporter-2 (CPA2) family protein n=1 Tax=Rhodovulum sp. DZ06 TaxID=3425126 RepID=UPI003D3583C7
MAASGELTFLADAAVFLGAAVLAVPVFKRLGLGSVIGYLAAGALIGPSGVALVPDPATVMHVAEFGVVLLLFVIGLELRPARLWRLRMEIFGLGLLQVAVTGVLLVGAFMLMGMSERASIAAGMALALSSTAFAIQLLREKGDLTRPFGDRAFSILLFQDLAIVPLLALVAFLAPGEGGAMNWTDLAIAVAAVAGLLLVGRYLLPHIFGVVARARADEIFTASALLVVIGASLLMDAVGLSMATGAFLAGVLLAETEFRHQLESDIEPFRGLLLGLFFMSFGMTLDWAVVAEAWWIVIGGALGLFALKIGVLWGLCRMFGSSSSDALRIGAYLGQGGEFAFVLFGAAVVGGVMAPDERSLLSAVVTLSMALTPLALMASARMARGEDDDAEGMTPAKDAPGGSQVLVAGFGRVGQVVARVMRMRGYSVTLIDNSPRRIRMAGTFGAKVYYGDARRIDVLRSAGAEKADMIFLCIDDRDGARAAVERLRHRFPDAILLADTYDRFSQLELFDAGAHEVVRETFESAVKLARLGLERMGDGDVADELIEEFRRADAERTRLEREIGAQAALEKLRDKYSLNDPF